MAQDCQAFSRQEKSGRVKLGGREEWPAGWGGVEGRSDRAGDWPCRSDKPGHTRLLHTADTGRLLVCRVFLQRFLLIQKCKNVRKLFLYKKQFGLFMEMYDYEISKQQTRCYTSCCINTKVLFHLAQRWQHHTFLSLYCSSVVWRRDAAIQRTNFYNIFIH